MPFLCWLRDAGHEVHVCAPGGDEPLIAKLALAGIRFHPVKLDRAALTPLSDVLYLHQIYSLVRALRIQGFFAYTHKPVCLGIPAAAAAGVRTRVALITGLGYGFTGDKTIHRRLTNAALRVLYRQALSQATHVFFQNADDRAEFAQIGLLDIEPMPEIVPGSGVPLNEFPYAPLSTKPPIFLMLSRLLVDKGVREYVAAAELVKQIHPDARFMLAGDFDQNPSAITKDEVDMWAQSGVIEYMGALEDVRPALRLCTVYVLPSYREGMPRSVLEAMSTGRPILTTDTPGCRETLLNLGPADSMGIRRGDNGIAVPPKSTRPLAAAMSEFISAGEERLNKFAKISRNYAESRFDVKRVSAQLAKAFE